MDWTRQDLASFLVVNTVTSSFSSIGRQPCFRSLLFVDAQVRYPWVSSHLREHASRLVELRLIDTGTRGAHWLLQVGFRAFQPQTADLARHLYAYNCTRPVFWRIRPHFWVWRSGLHDRTAVFQAARLGWYCHRWLECGVCSLRSGWRVSQLLQGNCD